MLVNIDWVNNEIKEEIGRYLETIKMKAQRPQTYGTQ